MPKTWQPKAWLLFIYKVPSEPARKRVFVWRRLTQLGALYLQQVVCLLPHSDERQTDLENLATRVREFGGETTLLRAVSMDATWENNIVKRFNADRDTLYAKMRDETAKFVHEIEREVGRRHYTVGELDELEGWLEGLRRRLEKVKQHDFFRAKGASQTRDALKVAEERLEAFAARVEQATSDQ